MPPLLTRPCLRQPLLDFLAPSCPSSTRTSSNAPQRTRPSAIQSPPARPFSSTPAQASRIGKMPITIPAGVKLTLFPPPPLEKGQSARLKPQRYLMVQGPRGELKLDIPDYMSIVPVAEQDANAADTAAAPPANADPSARSRKIELRVLDSGVRTQRAMWGTSRQYISNYIVGVAEGHSVILRLVGVGYRASIENSATTKTASYPGQKFVNLKVGYSHPIELGLPQGVTATCPVPTRILLEGNDKEVVKQFAAEIREWRRPEPYKGKGIFVGDETIKLKSKSIK